MLRDVRHAIFTGGLLISSVPQQTPVLSLTIVIGFRPAGYFCLRLPDELFSTLTNAATSTSVATSTAVATPLEVLELEEDDDTFTTVGFGFRDLLELLVELDELYGLRAAGISDLYFRDEAFCWQQVMGHLRSQEDEQELPRRRWPRICSTWTSWWALTLTIFGRTGTRTDEEET